MKVAVSTKQSVTNIFSVNDDEYKEQMSIKSNVLFVKVPVLSEQITDTAPASQPSSVTYTRSYSSSSIGRDCQLAVKAIGRPTGIKAIANADTIYNQCRNTDPVGVPESEP